MSMRPSMPSVLLSRRAKIILAVIAILVVLVILFVQFSGVYVNFLWYGSFGHRNVYSTSFWTRVVLFFVFGALMAVIIAGNLALAYRLRPPFRPLSPEQQNLQHYVQLIEPRRRWLIGGVFALTLLAEGASAEGDWKTWQLWLHSTSFGQRDRLFNKDIGFYAFDYPVYRLLLSFGFTAAIVSLILCIGMHYLCGAIRLQTPGPKITLAARRHLTVIVFVFMALKAAAYWLDRYGFVFSERSKFTGASYTDVHSAMPAKTILFWIAIVLAIGVLASIWLRSALLPGIGFVVLLILSILIGGIYPAVVQQVSVKPNASDKEAPYIGRNIQATRQAYGIADSDKGGSVTYESYKANTKPSGTSLADTDTTVDNIRILDPNVVSPTFTAQQKIGQPYGFERNLDIDRYATSDSGVTAQRDYVVAVREQVTGSNLTGSQNNWINQHTVYTHGYGFVAARADTDVTNGTQDDYTEGNIPPVGPLDNTTPDVYYGRLMNDYSVVGAKGVKREFDANNQQQQRVRYTGKGGVSLSNPFTKLAFAVKYGETNFILNDAVGAAGAKIIFDRDPKTMVEKLAPFLTVDQDPYPVVDPDNGHIVWMLDGYTTMANYPYSERQSLSDLTGTTLRAGQRDTQINYIRNSVKATVDAYDGTVHLYDWDKSDPLLKAWKKVFPGLIEPQSAMPSALKEHVRYPQDLFDVQRGLLAQYHITNAVDSYNASGKWAVPSDPFSAGSQAQPSYYVLAKPPGSSSNEPQFQLTTPMLVTNSQNLAAYISVNSDYGPDYGKLTVLQVPTKTTFYGPAQIANDLKNEATISKDLTQLDQGQTSVIHGNLLTLPIGDSFLYVEPLYVQSTAATAFPTLQRVLVRYGNQVGYGSTLESALDDIRLDRTAGSSINLGQTTGNGGSAQTGGSSSRTPSPSTTPTTPSGTSTPPTGTSTPTTTPPSGSGVPSNVNQVLDDLDQARTQLNNAYDSHDPVKIGEAQKRVNDLLDDYARLRSSSASPPK